MFFFSRTTQLYHVIQFKIIYLFLFLCIEMNHILYRSQNADAMSESELSRLEYERELEEDNLDPITGNIKPIFIDLDYVISITFCCQLEQEALEIKTSMAHRLSFELITHRLAYHGVVTFIDSDLFYFILLYFSRDRSSNFHRKTEIEELLNERSKRVQH